MRCIASICGSRFEGELPEDGIYLIQVNQMRSAARRDQEAKYRFDIAIDQLHSEPISPEGESKLD